MSEKVESITNPAGVEQPASLPSASRSAATPAPAAPLLMSVKLPIRILLGRTRLCLREITQLGSGAVIELDCCPDDPVEIIVNDRVIAHGEVVVVSGNYGVRITKIASQNETSDLGSESSDLIGLSERLR